MLHKNKGSGLISDLMKQSSLIYTEDGKLYNYYSSPVENCVSTIAIHKKICSSDDVVGINCFGELLLKSELISYAKNNFSQEIKEDKVLFYSKSLDLYVYEQEGIKYMKYLNDGQESNFGYDV